MQKKLTISIDEQIYYGLCRSVGEKKINRFIEDLVRPYVQNLSLHEGYKQMAADKEREIHAQEWSESTLENKGTGKKNRFLSTGADIFYIPIKLLSE